MARLVNPLKSGRRQLWNAEKGNTQTRKNKTNPGLFPRRVRRRNEWTACSAFCRCFVAWWFKCASVCLEGCAMSSLKACKRAASRGESRLSGLRFSWRESKMVRLVEPEWLLGTCSSKSFICGLLGSSSFTSLTPMLRFQIIRPLWFQWLAAEPKASCPWFCFFYCLSIHLEPLRLTT